jgi:hypothetical protein
MSSLSKSARLFWPKLIGNCSSDTLPTFSGHLPFQALPDVWLERRSLCTSPFRSRLQVFAMNIGGVIDPLYLLDLNQCPSGYEPVEQVF